MRRPRCSSIVGVTADRKKELLAMMEGYRESRESWRDVLRSLRRRGLKKVRLFIGDGGLGLWAAVDAIYPAARHQLCWCHKIVNVLDKLPQRLQPEARTLLRDIYAAPTRRRGGWSDQEICRALCARLSARGELLGRARSRAADVLRLPARALEESPDIEPLRTRATRRMRKAQTGLYLVFQLVRRAEQRWRRIDAPRLVAKVLDGVRFVNGVEVRDSAKQRKGAA